MLRPSTSPVRRYAFAALQKADVKHSFGKLRSEALLTFNQAWSQPGGRPCTGDLPAMLVADLTGSKPAAHPADSDGLLKLMWEWTQPCRGSGSASRSGNSAVCLYVCALQSAAQILSQHHFQGFYLSGMIVTCIMLSNFNLQAHVSCVVYTV